MKNQVKFKVRHSALLLKEFTVADIVRATQLKPESVRTELQRMKREGLISSQTHPNPPKQRGAPPALYCLSEDPELRLELSQSIDAYFPTPPQVERPTSRAYLLAQRLFNRAEEEDGREKEKLLDEAERHLIMAEQAEGGQTAPDNIKIYLQYERARLAYLRGEYEESNKKFKSLNAYFADIGDELTVRLIEEYRICINTWQEYGTFGPTQVEVSSLARSFLGTLDTSELSIVSPITSLALHLLKQLSISPEDKTLAAAFNLVIRQPKAEIEVREFRPVGRHERGIRELVPSPWLESDVFHSVSTPIGSQEPSLPLIPLSPDRNYDA